MAFNVANIQEQVQLQTNTNGLNDKVLGWTNRVLMEIATHALWPKQSVVHNQPTSATATNATTVVSQWVDLNTTAVALNPIQILQMEAVKGAAETFLRPVYRHEPQDFYAYWGGQAASTSASTPSVYAVPSWYSTTSGAANQVYVVPQVAMYPLVNTNNTATINLSLSMHCAPDKLTGTTGVSGGESLWIMQQYFHVVLAGVMRWCDIYLGDYQAYLIEKSKFVNGLKDMIKHEMSSLASTPVRRGVYPETMLQDFQGGQQ